MKKQNRDLTSAAGGEKQRDCGGSRASLKPNGAREAQALDEDSEEKNCEYNFVQ